MNHALQLAHGKALAAADSLKSPFERILAYRDIVASANDALALALSSANGEVKRLLSTGTPLVEIAERTGLSEYQVKRLGENPGTGAGAPG